MSTGFFGLATPVGIGPAAPAIHARRKDTVSGRGGERAGAGQAAARPGSELWLARVPACRSQPPALRGWHARVTAVPLCLFIRDFGAALGRHSAACEPGSHVSAQTPEGGMSIECLCLWLASSH